jgi:hypothetical protein
VDNTGIFWHGEERLERYINPIERAVLGLGWKFLPRYSATVKKIKRRLYESLDAFIYRLRWQLYFGNSPSRALNRDRHIPRIENKSFLISPSNCSWEKIIDRYEKKCKKRIRKLRSLNSPSRVADIAIIRALNSLRHNKDIEIKPADKNLGTVVMDKETYNTMCYEVLNDEETYEFVSPEHNYSADRGYALLRGILRKHNQLYSQGSRLNQVIMEDSTKGESVKRQLSALARSLLQLEGMARPGKFYVLPKMHKPVVKGRPIVPSKGTMTYHTSRFLHNVLHPILKRLLTVCQSNLDIILALTQLEDLPEGAVILCADVRSLYPSIPIEYGLESIDIILERHASDIVDYASRRLYIDLLRWVLTNNFLTFNSKEYHQRQGTAMGTPVAPTYANMVLSRLEEVCLALGPIFYRRFIDDLFVICRNELQARQIVEAFNSRCPSIQLESITIGKTGIFLDMEISIEDNKPMVNIYQKKINKYLYIPPTSNHPPHVMKNVIKGEIRRYRLLCQSEDTYKEITKLFKERLSHRGYDGHYLNEIFGSYNPSREELLARLKEKKAKVMNVTGKALYPVVVTELPHLSSIKPVRFAFTLTDALKNSEVFGKTFEHKRLVIGRKLGKAAGRYFLHRPP